MSTPDLLSRDLRNVPTARRLAQRGKATRGGVLWWLGQVASWFFLFLVLAIVGLLVVVPRLAGAEAYTVLTGSMAPGIQPGDLVVVKPAAADQVAIGSIVTYQLVSGESAVVTHRVIGLSIGTDGTQRFITQGDANNAPDSASVRPVQLRGVLWYSVPLLGYLNTAINGELHMVFLVLAVSALLGYAAAMLFGACRDRWRQPVMRR